MVEAAATSKLAEDSVVSAGISFPAAAAVNIASLAVASVLIALSNLMLARVAINPPQSCQLDITIMCA